MMLTLRSYDPDLHVTFAESNVNVKIMIRYARSAGHLRMHREARGILTVGGGSGM